MTKLGISENDIEESFILGGGPGGQKVNKTSSCVRLLHTPTGIEIKCRQSRSLAINRYFAREKLCERITEAVKCEKSNRIRQIEKIRRQKRRRSRRQKEKMLRDKNLRSEKKEARKPVETDD